MSIALQLIIINHGAPQKLIQMKITSTENTNIATLKQGNLSQGIVISVKVILLRGDVIENSRVTDCRVSLENGLTKQFQHILPTAKKVNKHSYHFL